MIDRAPRRTLSRAALIAVLERGWLPTPLLVSQFSDSERRLVPDDRTLDRAGVNLDAEALRDCRHQILGPEAANAASDTASRRGLRLRISRSALTFGSSWLRAAISRPGRALMSGKSCDSASRLSTHIHLADLLHCDI